VGATRAAIPYIIRGANHKSYLEIHREIRASQTQALQPGMPAAFRFMMATPWPLPPLFIRLIRELIESGYGLEEARTNGPRLSAAD